MVQGISASVHKNFNLVGCSDAFASVKESIGIIAPRKSPVIITGPTGSGKEMVARQIHFASPRAPKPFIPVDCTALTDQLFESQLFGHTKGAFTGALSDTLGFFRAADGGTIFLDEIGEMSLDLQAKLLRILQDSIVMPVGSTQYYPVDCRVLCATNRDLKDMVREGSFRSDLYFRLNVMTIEVPSLSARPEDIILLANYFLDKQADFYQEPAKKLGDSAIKIMLGYAWPGNVRELSNAMEYAYVICKGHLITACEMPEHILNNEIILPGTKEPLMSFEQLQKRLIVKALKISNGKKMKAARMLKIDHRKLARLVQEFDIEPTWK